MFNFDLYIFFSPIITNGIICRGNAFKKGPEPPLIFQDLQYVLRSNSLSGPGPSHHRRAVATEYHRPSQGINIHIPPNGKLGKSSTQICHFLGGYVRKPWRYTPFCTLNKTGFFCFKIRSFWGLLKSGRTAPRDMSKTLSMSWIAVHLPEKYR